MNQQYTVFLGLDTTYGVFMHDSAMSNERIFFYCNGTFTFVAALASL